MDNKLKKKKKRAGEPKSKRQVKLNIHRLFPLGVRDGQELFTATFPVREQYFLRAKQSLWENVNYDKMGRRGSK